MNIYSELNDWTTRNIYPPNYGDKIPEQVKGDILIHKFRYVNFLISKAKENWQNMQNLMNLNILN
jgi:DNA primase